MRRGRPVPTRASSSTRSIRCSRACIARRSRSTASCRRPTSAFGSPTSPPGSSTSRPTRRRSGAWIARWPRSFPELDRSVVSGVALERLEPAVAAGLWACRVGIGFPVFPGASTYAYATLAERRGATIRLGRTASLDVRGDEVVGVIVDGRRLACDAVLVAAGPWSPGLIDPGGRWTPIRHRWGVVVEAELAAGPSHVLEEAEIGAAIGVLDPVGPADDGPRTFDPEPADPDAELVDFSFVPLDGVASVGSTFLARQPEPAAWIEPILRNAATFVPGIADAPIRGTRACARPQSADGRPLIGQVPGRRGLFICAGHGAWGISTGPASARLVVDQMLGRESPIPAALDPGRFGGID